ncbi:Centromere protein L [Myotis davidii]|uniref:Centromere protein L n=1 Tax=Myotis davidii TaxID=225400 RepID=L5LP17_MYODS|nr:Centromere protein L [Myotis davidii]
MEKVESGFLPSQISREKSNDAVSVCSELQTMDSYATPESTPRRSASSRLKDHFIGATPLQKRLESVRKLTSFVPPSPQRKIPQCSQLQEDVDPQKVAFLLHKQWTLYSLTPLYKFSYTNLKEYSKFLSAFIVAEKQKGLAVEVGEDLNIKVIFSTLLGMKGTQRDPDAFLVQFGRQEPGTNAEIKEYAAGYNVKFDMYSKIFVNGDDAHPLWKWMKTHPKGRGILGNAIKWNFTKFLIDKNGCVVKRYGPMEEPQILSKSQLPSENREGKVLWTGWFCCIFGDSLLETVSEDFTCLPLFLANGAETNTALIGTWFQKTFDCHFSPLAINAFNLSWMAAMWTACKMDHYVATTEFLWSVPCSPQSLDISYAIHPEDAKALWDSVHKVPGEVTQEEVDLFMDCLCSHFHRHFKIHLSATRLVRVSTSVASAHTNGKIKILCHKYLIGVLAYLTELAIFQIE